MELSGSVRVSGDEKKIDIEMLFFFMGVSLFSFSFYVFRHPLFYITSASINRRALLSIYIPDLLIYFSVLIPYLLILLTLTVRAYFMGKVVHSKYFPLLFFPLFSFFSKGMYLPMVYIDYMPFTIVKSNFGFFSFLFIGVILTIIQNRLRKIHGNN